MKKIEINIDKIFGLHNEGLSERKIAKIMNVSRSFNKSTVCEIDAGATRKSIELKEKRNGKRSNER